MFSNPVLADTYERVLRESSGPGGREAEIERARRVWSEGFVADAIETFCRTQDVMDVSGRAHRGVLTGADMAGWSATVELPIEYDYGRYRVQKPGPWCQGLAALQQLALLKGFPLDGLDPTGPDFIHWQVEAAKLAFADRDTFYGDPDFVEVPVGILLSDAYNAKRRALIGDRASLEQRPGRIPGYGKVLEARVSEGGRTAVGSGGAGEPTVGQLGESKGDTVHFDIIDQFGNMVSATPSGGWLQSSPTIPKLGFCLGTRAQMFTMDEQHPACLAPGKRPRSTLSPTIALRDGDPILPGARRAGTSRTNGSRSSSSAMSMRATISRKRSTPRPGTPSISRRPSGPAPLAPACLSSKAACRTPRSRTCGGAVMSSRSERSGRKGALSLHRVIRIA